MQTRRSAILLIAIIFVPRGAITAQPPQYGQFERVHFTTLQTQARVNPFAGVKLVATFTWQGTYHFRVPVVCTSQSTTGGVTASSFPVIFTPPLQGSWTWQVTAEAGGQHFGPLPGSGAPLAFLCVPSSHKGFWRPADPPYRFTVARPVGNGTTEPVWPLTAMYSHLANPGWPGWLVADKLQKARDDGFTRVRIMLSSVDDRSQPNNPPAVMNHTVFARTGPGFQPAQVDFERFDLAQWRQIDHVILLAERLGLEVAVTVTFNTGSTSSPINPPYDYEEHYLSPGFDNPQTPLPLATVDLVPLQDPTAFATRDELYYWYVIGRLSHYTNVDWCLMHEFNLIGPEPGHSRQDAWAAWFGRRFVALEPYMSFLPGSNADVDSRILTVCPRRGGHYTSWLLSSGALNPGRYHQLCLNVSSYLTQADDDWRSAIGIQRGGELGITSIVESITPDPATQSCSTPPAHRTALLSNGTPRPIFIEEEWIVKNTPNPVPGVHFGNDLNPYCYCLANDATGACVALNPMPDRFAFITSNQMGLRKWIRDAAWKCAVISQGYMTWYGPDHENLLEPVTTTAWHPLRAARLWTDRHDWWRFAYDPNVVTPSHPPVPDRFELQPMGATSDHGGAGTQILCYNPTPASAPVDMIVDLSLLPGSIPCRWINPDTGEESPLFFVTGGGPVVFASAQAGPAYQGEHGEVVLMVNEERVH